MVVRPTGSGVGVTVVVVSPRTGEVVVKGLAVVDPVTVALLVDELPLALPTRVPAPQGCSGRWVERCSGAEWWSLRWRRW